VCAQQAFGGWPAPVRLLLALKQSGHHRLMSIRRKEGVP
jgi:hypothetical protein